MLRRGCAFSTTKLYSTVVGKSGRLYKRVAPLQQRQSVGAAFDIHLAECNEKAFVLKPVTRSMFTRMQELQKELTPHPYLRLPLDSNEDGEYPLLVYKYYSCDALDVLRNEPGYPLKFRKRILKEVGTALKDMHSKDWLHMDVKPDNIFLNTFWDNPDKAPSEQTPHLLKVALGDLESAQYLPPNHHFQGEWGNVMWRSPEGHLRAEIGKPSEVFTFGLLSLFVITGAHIQRNPSAFKDEDLKDHEIAQLYLYQLIEMFGPLADGLIDHFPDDETKDTLRGLKDVHDEDDAPRRFEELEFPNLDNEAKRFISSMTNLDPAKRVTMAEILEDPYLNDTAP